MFHTSPRRWGPARLLAAFATAALFAGFASACGEDQTTAADSRQVQKAMAQYKDYLEAGSEKLTHWAETIVAKAKEGALEKPASRYAASRVPFGQVGPAAELHGHLSSFLDSTEGGEPPIGFGFH